MEALSDFDFNHLDIMSLNLNMFDKRHIVRKTIRRWTCLKALWTSVVTLRLKLFDIVQR